MSCPFQSQDFSESAHCRTFPIDSIPGPFRTFPIDSTPFHGRARLNRAGLLALTLSIWSHNWRDQALSRRDQALFRESLVSPRKELGLANLSTPQLTDLYHTPSISTSEESVTTTETEIGWSARYHFQMSPSSALEEHHSRMRGSY